MLCITLCLQLPNRKSVVNYFNKSSYFCSNVYKSQKLYFLLLYCDVELYKVSYCIVLPLCSSDIHFVFKIHPSLIQYISEGWQGYILHFLHYLTNVHVGVAIIIFSVTKLYILKNSIYNINFIILVHFISFKQSPYSLI